MGVNLSISITTCSQLTVLYVCDIGARTGLVGPAMAGPFSAKVETCVRLFGGLVPRLRCWSFFKTRCRDGVNVLWCHSHLVWLVFEGSIRTCTCFQSETFL